MSTAAWLVILGVVVAVGIIVTSKSQVLVVTAVFILIAGVRLFVALLQWRDHE